MSDDPDSDHGGHHDDEYNDIGGVDGDDGAPSSSRKRRGGGSGGDGMEKKPRVAKPKKKGGRRRKKKDSDEDDEPEEEESEFDFDDEDDYYIPQSHQETVEVVKDTTLYCLCRQTYNPRRPMVGCDVCDEWYHLACVNLKKADAEAMPTYECPTCKKAREEGRPIVRKVAPPSDAGGEGEGAPPAEEEGHGDGSQQQQLPLASEHNGVHQQVAQQQMAYPGAYTQIPGRGVLPVGVYPGYPMQVPQQMLPQGVVPNVNVGAPVGGAPGAQLTFGQLSEADKERYRRQLALRNQAMMYRAQAQAVGVPGAPQGVPQVPVQQVQQEVVTSAPSAATSEAAPPPQ